MKPYEPEALPPRDLDRVALEPILGKANRAIGVLEGLLYGIPNPNVLLSPISTQEAVLSSKIEGTQADLEDVFKFQAGETPTEPKRQEDIREIMNYRKALSLSESLLEEKPFCLNTLLKLHEVLMDGVRGQNKGRGKFRTTQNWIGIEGTSIDQAFFVPPNPLYLEEHLNKWEAYWHSEGLDILLQLALVHAQFEILHPFIDGNGRIGRMIIPLFLFEKRILSRPCFYLSAFFEARRDEYVGRLRELGQSGSWTHWCRFFLEGVAVQAESNMNKARAIQDLYEGLKTKVLKLTRSSYAVPLLDFMFQQPIFRSGDITKLEHMPSAPMVGKLLTSMRDNGILHLVRPASGQRPQILALGELINICEEKKVIG